ncbi:nickel pincer cofactor biosynthesis protein LarC [Aneurinibacillus terranovensis]|uniref:nickel pincer cofactor biosynthesis protein LarC n=1 Tax=Aneurinibacillus terranovensis TaxID=278991 RepID=UPI00047F3AFD|nr:nickel pincer cofactor biosynthesis protein LarC [Aneurinibacillus terranovensis]
MKTLYLDCISGISGDMTLAALIDLGADLSYIVKYLRKLPIDPFEIEVHKIVKRGIAAKKLQIYFPSNSGSRTHTHKGDEHEHHHHDHDHEHEHEHHHHDHDYHHEHRSVAQILEMIEQSDLPARVKARSFAIFQEVAIAEGKIHGIDPREVHFHEVGAMDSIIDTIGVCLALENLGIDEIYASPVPTGYGKKRMAHGLYPIPAPATLELLKGIPLAELNVKGELTTPTGAGILRALVKKFILPGAFTVEQIGYGAGEKEFDHPNVLRVLFIKLLDLKKVTSKDETQQGRESIFVLEAQVDDMTGEGLGYTMESLFSAGALDVFYTPVYMKKNRPGTLVTVLVSSELAERCETVLLAETTTLGVRRSLWSRNILDRKFIVVDTPYGQIRVKQAFMGNKMMHQAPEYEDVAKAAREHQVSFQEVYQYAIS